MLQPKEKLYKQLSNDGLYNKSYEEFETQFSTPEKQESLFQKLSADGLYSKSKDEFVSSYFNNDVKKKESTQPISKPTSQSQKSASVQEVGSSAIANNDPFNSKSQFDIPKKGKNTTKEVNTFTPGSAAWAHQNEKLANPRYSQLYQEYKNASVVPDEEKQRIVQEVDDEANNSGFLNKARSVLAKGASMLPSWLGGTTGKDVDPLYKEKEQAKKELQTAKIQASKTKKPIPEITEQSITDRAKQIAINKRIDSQSESQVRDFISQAEDNDSGVANLSEKDYIKQYLYGERNSLNERDKINLKKQEILKPAIDNTVKEVTDIGKQAEQYINSNQPVPEDLKQQYQEKYKEYQDLVSDAIKVRDEFVNNQEDLGSLQDNIDIVKRDYSWGKNFSNNLAATTLELGAGALGALDYLGQVMPTIGAYSSNLRSGNKKLREIAENERGEIIKPISVDDINGPKDLGRWISATAAQQVPIFALIATGTGGIATIGATSTGQKFEEMQDEQDAGTSDYSMTQTLGIPLAFGATETASAMVDSYLLKGVGRSIKAATQPERRLIAEGFVDGLKNNLSKLGTSGTEILKNTSIEATDEAATQLSQNLLDKYAGEKSDIDIWDGVKDSAAAGAAMGLLLPLGGNVISTIAKPFSTDTQIQDTSKQILNLEKLLGNPELSDATRQVTEKELAKSEDKLKSLVKKTATNTASLSNEQFDEVIKLEKEQSKLQQTALEIDSDPSTDEDTKKMLINPLKEEFEAKNQKRVDILNNKVNEQNANQTTKPEAQPQTEEQTQSNEVADVNDTNVVNTPSSNNSQIKNATENNTSQESTTEIPNPNQISNETEQGENTPVDGNVRPESGKLGEVGETRQQQAEAVNEESTQSTVEPRTSESEPKVDKLQKTTRENLDSNFENVEEQILPENSKFAGKSEFTAKTGDYILNIKPSKSGYDVFLRKPYTDTGGVSSSGEIESWFPINEQELNNVVNEARELISNLDPTLKPKTVIEEKPEKPKKRKKSVVRRLYEGETSETTKAVAEDLGLTYEIENQQEAQESAKSFVKKVGITKALDAARSGIVKGAEKAFVYADVLDQLTEAIDNADPAKKAEMEEQYLAILTEATNDFDQEARQSGRFISALNRIYNTSKIKYSLERQVERYKASNNGEIDAATLAKFKEADAKIKELEQKIKEAQARAIEAEEKSAMDNINESIQRVSESEKTTKQKAKKLANQIRKAKITRPDVFNAATAGIVWDTAIEIVAKTIEAGGTLAEAVQKGATYIKRSKWYKGLSEDKKSDAISSFENSLASTNNNEAVTVDEDGTINIPNSVIRTLVEMGAKDIDSLSQKILDMISEDNPEITLRNVRDAVTKYGKTINPTKDAIQKEINLMKRLGRLISANEDVDAGNRPLRSGLQREQVTQEERRLKRQLTEKLRDLPLDNADLEKEWKNTLETIKSRLKNQIEDLNKQIEKGEKRKPERNPVAYDEEANALREVRDNLKKELDDISGKPELTEEQKVQRAINQLEKSNAKLQEQIASGNIDFKEGPKKLNSEELTALRDIQKSLTDELNKMRKDAGLIEKKKLSQAKDRVQKRIKELQEKIDSRDYSKRKSEPIEKDDELLKLESEKVRWQEVYDRAVYENELKNRPKSEKIWEGIVGAANIFRILKATGEFSPVLVQGGIYTINMAVRKPMKLAKAFGKMFAAFGSAKTSDLYEARMKADPNYATMKLSKLALVEPDYKLELREEQFVGNYINNIWNYLGTVLENVSGKTLGVTETIPIKDKLLSLINKDYEPGKVKISEQFKQANPLLAFERGLTVYMNEIRMDKFNDGVTMLEMEGKNIVDNKKDYEKVATAINTMTGRANMPKSLVQAGPILGVIFFSFRNTLSVINQINPAWYALQKDYTNGEPWYKPSVAQKIAVYDMIRFITITTGMMYLFKAAAGDDDDGKPVIEIETDPRSSDFMKMKDGNARFDAFHGMLPMVVFFMRQFSGEIKSSGEVKELGSGRFTPTRSDLLVNIGANKLSPQAAIGWRYANTRVDKDGKRVTKFGEPYDLSKELDLSPIYINSLIEISKEDPDAYAQFLSVMGLFGINSQVYASKAAKSGQSKLSPELQKRAEEAKERAKEFMRNR